MAHLNLDEPLPDVRWDRDARADIPTPPGGWPKLDMKLLDYVSGLNLSYAYKGAEVKTLLAMASQKQTIRVTAPVPYFLMSGVGTVYQVREAVRLEGHLEVCFPGVQPGEHPEAVITITPAEYTDGDPGREA